MALARSRRIPSATGASLALAILCAGYACQGGDSSTTRAPVGNLSEAAERNVIESALNAWVAAYNAKDLTGVLTIWSRDFLGWFYGAPEFGYRDAEQGYANGFADTSVSRTYTLTVHEIQVFGEIGFARVTFHQTETTWRQVSRTDIMTMQVWTHQSDGAWRIVRTVSFPQTVQ